MEIISLMTINQKRYGLRPAKTATTNDIVCINIHCQKLKIEKEREFDFGEGDSR